MQAIKHVASDPPFARMRFKSRKKPLVDLPPNADALLKKVTDCLITHSRKFEIKALQHTDHLDIPGEDFLRAKNTPITFLDRFGTLWPFELNSNIWPNLFEIKSDR